MFVELSGYIFVGGFKGFNISPTAQKIVVPFTFEGKEYSLTHGILKCVVLIINASSLLYMI